MTLHQIRTHPQPVDGCFACRVSTVSVGGVGKHDRTRQKAWDAELDRYAAAKAQGIQPDGTTTKKILAAEKWSEKNQMPYSQTLKTKVDTLAAIDRLL